MVSTQDSHPTVPNMRAEVVCLSKLIPNNRPMRPEQPLGEREGGAEWTWGPGHTEIPSMSATRSTLSGAIGQKQRRRSAENLGPPSAISAVSALALVLAEYLEWR